MALGRFVSKHKLVNVKEKLVYMHDSNRCHGYTKDP